MCEHHGALLTIILVYLGNFSYGHLYVSTEKKIQFATEPRLHVMCNTAIITRSCKKRSDNRKKGNKKFDKSHDIRQTNKGRRIVFPQHSTAQYKLMYDVHCMQGPTIGGRVSQA